MSNANHTATTPDASHAATHTMEDGFELFLSKLSARDRLNVDKHLAACEASSPEHGALWRRLAGGLMVLCEHSARLLSRSSAQFYKADGKYRMQAFALEDVGDGKLTIYCTDVLDRALDAELIAPLTPKKPDIQYRAGATDDLLEIEQLDRASSDPAPLYKDMLGWNRKAIRITFPANATAAQVSAVEALASLAFTATR